MTGCSPVYYAPDALHVPLHKKAGELRLSGGHSDGLEISSFGFQGSMAVMDNVAIMGSMMIADEGTENNENDFKGSGNGHLLCLGLGYFNNYGPLAFETFGGMGWGRVDNDYYDQGTVKMRFNRPFIQPSVGLKFKIFELAVSSRFSFVDFHRISSENLVAYEQEQLDEIKRTREYWFWEPAVTARLGVPFLKVQMQIRTSTPLNEDFKDHDPFMITLGAITEFDLFN